MAIARHFEYQEQESQPSTQASLSSLKLVPYVEINGSRTISDSYLSKVFDEIVVEGLVSTIFGGIEMRHAGDFIRLMKNPANLPVFVIDGETCVGFAWLNNIAANYAYGHFCYFKNAHYDSLQFGRLILGYWFSLKGTAGPILDVIIGTVPSFNQKASHYVQKLGFTKLGEIPNMYINIATKERWASMIHYLARPKNE